MLLSMQKQKIVESQAFLVDMHLIPQVSMCFNGTKMIDT